MSTDRDGERSPHQECRNCGDGEFVMFSAHGYVDMVCSQCGTPFGNGFDELEEVPDVWER